MANLTPALLDALDAQVASGVTVWAGGTQWEVCMSATHDVIASLVEAARERDKQLAELHVLRGENEDLRSADLEPFCDGCGQEIDPTTCGCGSEMPCNEHGIPMGCCCLRADHGDGDIAKGLRARLREERAAAAKELDQLLAEVASLRTQLDEPAQRRRERAETLAAAGFELPVSKAAETMVGEMMAEARRSSTVREALARQAPVMAKLAEIEALEAEVERLRELGLEALRLAWFGNSALRAQQVRTEIEKKLDPRGDHRG